MAFQEPFPRFVFLAVFVSKVLAISLNTDLDRERKCHFRTISCPCNLFYGKSSDGFEVSVSYRECGIQLEPLCQGCAHGNTKAVCSGKIVLAKCKRGLSAYSPRQRRKRDTSSCSNNTIFETPNKPKGPPSVTIDGILKTVKVDAEPKFTCDVYNANPAVEISWLLNGKVLAVNPTKYLFTECRQMLTIKHVGVADAGNYTCVVQNAYGKVNASVKLEVVPPPGPDITSIKLGGDRNSAYITSSINITCRSSYSDTSHFYNGTVRIEEKSGSHKYTFYKSTERSTQVTTLQIQNITVEDAGNYTCVAVKLGIQTPDFKTFLLKVETCPAGYYCPWGSNHAVPCPPGTYRNASSNEMEHCIMCKEGHYCPPGSRLPEPCPRGTYLPFNNGSSYKDCISCPDMPIAVEDGDDEPATRKEDCPSVNNNVTVPKEDEVASPSGTLTTSETLGVVGGTVGAFLLIAVKLYCAVKRDRWLSCWVSKVSSKHQDLESYAGTTVASRNGHLLQRLENSKQNTANDEIEKVPVEMEYEVRYDVFICYSSKDTSWVKTLLEELETRGFSCCIDFRDFVPGTAIVQNISEAIYHSRKTIAVLSPDFVESDWCSHELQKALTRIRFHQVVPIVHKHCEIPMVLQDRTYLDWENCHVKPYFWDQLENALNRSHDGVLL